MPRKKEQPVEPNQPERLEVLAALSGASQFVPCILHPELARVLGNSLTVILSCGGHVSCWFDNSLGIYSFSVRLGDTPIRKRATDDADYVRQLWGVAEKFRPLWDKLFPGEVWPGPTLEWLNASSAVEQALQEPTPLKPKP